MPKPARQPPKSGLPPQGRRRLTAQDEIFVAEYLKDLDPCRAAVAAGYAQKTALTHAYEWVTNPAKKPALYEHLRAKLDARVQKLDLSAERILEEIARIAFSNMDDFIGQDGKVREIDLSKLNRAQAAALSELSSIRAGKSLTNKIKTHDKLGALTLLAKYRNLLSADAAVTVNVNTNVALADRVNRAKKRGSGS